MWRGLTNAWRRLGSRLSVLMRSRKPIIPSFILEQFNDGVSYEPTLRFRNVLKGLFA